MAAFASLRAAKLKLSELKKGFSFDEATKLDIKNAKIDFVNKQLVKILDGINYLMLNVDVYKVKVCLDKSDTKTDLMTYNFDHMMRRTSTIKFPTTLIGIRSYKIWRKCHMETPLVTLRNICKMVYGYYFDFESSNNAYVYRYEKIFYPAEKVSEDYKTYTVPAPVSKSLVDARISETKTKYADIINSLKVAIKTCITKNLEKKSEEKYSSSFQIKFKKLVLSDGTKISYDDVMCNKDVDINSEKSHWKQLGSMTPLELCNSIATEYGGTVVITGGKRYFYTNNPSVIISKEEDNKVKRRLAAKAERKIVVVPSSLEETPDFIPMPTIIGMKKTKRRGISQCLRKKPVHKSKRKHGVVCVHEENTSKKIKN